MPEVDNEKEELNSSPSWVNVNCAAREEYLGRDGLNGVTQLVKERITSRPVKNDEGV
jgi:hypothetical protein